LTSLQTENLKMLHCNYNRLTSLHLNKNLEKLYCNCNLLTSLHLNENLRELSCHNNRLSSLHLPETLQRLYCFQNLLTSLHLNENLIELYCSNNRLTSLHLNENVRICYHDNPIYEIIGDKHINKKMRVLNQFRYLYYCLKFKKRFRDLLWVKIREPKIREKYSHAYLVENLHEDTDLEELLNNW
jgi:Leucine-rich repeat (LRR) protein